MQAIVVETGAKAQQRSDCGRVRGRADSWHRRGRAHRRTIAALGLAERLNLAPPKDRWEFLWITSFPLFEWSPSEKTQNRRSTSFTGIVEEDIEKIESEPWNVRSRATTWWPTASSWGSIPKGKLVIQRIQR